MENYKQIDFDVFKDSKGALVPIENEKNIPFSIKRIFYIYNTLSSIDRGNHANLHSQFVLIAVSGSCKVKVRSKCKDEIFDLDSPSKGLWLNRMVWKEMYDFTPDAVLLVLSDCGYDSKEYITDYNEYEKKLKGFMI